MTPQTRIKLIRERMFFDKKYSFSQLYQIYSEIMNIDYYLVNCDKVKEKTLRNQLAYEAGSDSWLVFEDGLYFKAEPRCKFAEIHNKIIELYKRIETWAKLSRWN